jgi:hypothetical protein
MMVALSARLIRSDLIQLSTLFFAILLFSLMVSWPQGIEENRSWFIFVQTRIICLTLLGLGYGSQTFTMPKSEQRTTLLALLSLGVLSIPLEIACYAASFPDTVLGWSLGITLLDTVAFFGMGLGLSRLFHFVRLQALLPVINMVLLVLFMTFDFGVKTVIVNPLLAVTLLSPFHFAAMLGLTSLTLVWLLRS